MTPPLDGELEALDDALRRSVALYVETLTARAHDEADERIQRAQEEADALARRARDEGDAAGAAVFARENAGARRDSTTIVLDAKRAALGELRERVREAVVRMRDAPDYAQLLDGLTQRARARLGSDADVTRDPQEVGGIIAHQAGRRIDYTLTALANRALAEMGDALEELFA